MQSGLFAPLVVAARLMKSTVVEPAGWQSHKRAGDSEAPDAIQQLPRPTTAAEISAFNRLILARVGQSVVVRSVGTGTPEFDQLLAMYRLTQNQRGLPGGSSLGGACKEGLGYGAVIGAVVGLVIGVIVGILEAINGASTGAVLGTIFGITLGGAFLGLIGGAIYGCFRGRWTEG